jgi:hypothetical protein
LRDFIGAWIILDEVHITTIAVDPDVPRECGLAICLCGIYFDKAMLKKVVAGLLLRLMRTMKLPAGLYESFDFQKIGWQKSHHIMVTVKTPL